MKKVVSFGRWLSKWFTLFVVLWAVFNYFVPSFSAPVVANTKYLLGVILFGMGLTLTGQDFKRIVEKPIPVLMGTVAHYRSEEHTSELQSRFDIVCLLL